MPYLSSRDRCWPKLLKMSLGKDSLCEFAAREINLVMLASPSEDALSKAYERVLGHAYFLTCCSGFVSVGRDWPLLSALTRKLVPSLV